MSSQRFHKTYDSALIAAFMLVLIFTDKQETRYVPPAWWENFSVYAAWALLIAIVIRFYALTALSPIRIRVFGSGLIFVIVFMIINATFHIRLYFDDKEMRAWRSSLYVYDFSLSNIIGIENRDLKPFAWVTKEESRLRFTATAIDLKKSAEFVPTRIQKLEFFKAPCLSSDLQLEVNNTISGKSEIILVSGTQESPTPYQVLMDENAIDLDISAVNVSKGCQVSGDPRELVFGIFDPRYNFTEIK